MWSANFSFKPLRNVTITIGASAAARIVNVTTGWNLIGAADHDVAVSQLGIVPSGIIDSPFYGFDLIYQPSDTLRSGKGYFVKVSAGGKIIIP